MTKDKAAYIKNWLFRANEDIAVIKSLIKSGAEYYTSSICFHAQQASGKFLKAYLVYHDVNFPKTHDLDFLLLECQKIDKEAFHIDFKSLIRSESDLGRTTFSIQAETPAFMIISTFTVTERESIGPGAFSSKGKSANYFIDKGKNKAYLIASFYNDYIGEKQGPSIIRNQTTTLKYVYIEALSLIKRINKVKLDPNIEIKNRDQFLKLGLELKEDDNPILLIGKIAKK